MMTRPRGPLGTIYTGTFIILWEVSGLLSNDAGFFTRPFNNIKILIVSYERKLIEVAMSWRFPAVHNDGDTRRTRSTTTLMSNCEGRFQALLKHV